MYPSSEKRFLKVNKLAIITLFALIFAGGVVRSSGSGMGCPDWPRCFGQFIPPTEVSQLPANYKEKFVARRVAKNQKFAKMLDVFGYGDLAGRIRNDQTILKPEEFNVAKTWTEYINRLIGVLCGFFLTGCALLSTIYIKSRKRIFYLSLLNLVLVGFQGWLGSIVVSTNLLAWVVTIHMLIALVILAISIYTYFQARIFRDRHILANKAAGRLKGLVVLAVILTIIQITLGTEVREQIDAIADEMNHLNRSEWVAGVGLNFEIHRDLAILVVFINVLLFFLIRKNYVLNGSQFKYISYTVALIVMQIITGLVLSYLALPPVAQAAHILLACLLFGAQFYFMLLLKTNKIHNRELA